jgi:hypothetical protein
MRTFYFNTGVRPENCDGKLWGKQVWRGGVKQIPYDCENVPAGAVEMFLCDDPNLPDAELDNVIVRKVHNSDMISDYAYFRLLKKFP